MSFVSPGPWGLSETAASVRRLTVKADAMEARVAVLEGLVDEMLLGRIVEAVEGMAGAERLAQEADRG